MKNARLKMALLLGLLLPQLLVAQNKDFKGYRIFINPGHGGYDSDDRHMEATDFWESEGNLSKGLYLKKLLEEKKAKVFMSRTTNFTADDLDFTVLDEMANAANVDFFLSIHSNGGNGQINRPLVLFRGTDSQPAFPTAKALADTLWHKIYENGNCWTHNTPYVKGDLTFYPSWGKLGLAALRTLAVPGVLAEGSFHDYLPESWRLQNLEFLHQESWAMFRSFERYFEVKPSEDGMVSGIIRDAKQKANWKVPKGMDDQFMPVEDAVVTLMPGNRMYQVDHFKNGFYFFESVPPGTYTLYVNGPEGYAKDTASIVVEPNRTSRTDFRLKKDPAKQDSLFQANRSI